VKIVMRGAIPLETRSSENKKVGNQDIGESGCRKSTLPEDQENRLPGILLS
jgi:hypothetical protein